MTDSVRRLWKAMTGDEEDIYGLDHAILNVIVPPEKMWMNMGYWKDTTSFQDACQALLEKVLLTAGLLGEDKLPKKGLSCRLSNSPNGAVNGERLDDYRDSIIKLIDVGIGCGDQSLYLTSKSYQLEPQIENRVPDSLNTDLATDKSTTVPLFHSYVGVNVTTSQVNLARQRLLQASKQASAMPGHFTPDIKIFEADAAMPSSWKLELKEAISMNPRETPSDPPTLRHVQKYTWLLALDTLYHFKPSRKPLFECAFTEMQASIMAFDLLLGESASFWDKLYLRLICLVSGMPWSNFMSKTEYESMLVDAGYQRDRILMEDVSENVFSGIASFIRTREEQLKIYGMSLGKYKSPGKIFDWWAKSGVVRGYVIVAHRT